MRAAVLLRHGGPDAVELRDDWPEPRPGPGQVLVRVTAAALNNTDVWTREGAYGLAGDPDALAGWRGPLRFPRVQGGDVAGVVDQVGDGVAGTLLGRRVLVDPAIYADHRPTAPPVGLLGSEVDGGFAEYVVVDAAKAHDVSGSPLTDAELACLPIAYGTALGMLERGGLAAGETVLVTGASGGVGLALVQLAAARGATVVAVTSAGKQDAILASGADRTVLRDADGLPDQIRASAPDGLALVTDVAGGPALGQLMPLLGEDGRWVIAGALAGPVVPVDLRRLYLHNRRIIGSSMHTREHFAALVEVARSGAVRPRVAARYALADLHRAQQEFEQRHHVGKIVVVPEPTR